MSLQSRRALIHRGVERVGVQFEAVEVPAFVQRLLLWYCVLYVQHSLITRFVVLVRLRNVAGRKDISVVSLLSDLENTGNIMYFLVVFGILTEHDL